MMYLVEPCLIDDFGSYAQPDGELLEDDGELLLGLGGYRPAQEIRPGRHARLVRGAVLHMTTRQPHSRMPDFLSHSAWAVMPLSARAIEVFERAGIQFHDSTLFIPLKVHDKKRRNQPPMPYTMAFPTARELALDAARLEFAKDSIGLRQIVTWRFLRGWHPTCDVFREAVSSKWICTERFREVVRTERLGGFEFIPIDDGDTPDRSNTSERIP